MDQLWFWLHPFDPAQHGGWAMAPVLPFFVRYVLLEIVIGHPFVMGCQQILPSVRFLKAPVGHAPLNAKRRFSIILIGPSFFDFLFLDTQLFAHAPGGVRDEDAAVVADEDLWNPMLADRA